MRRTLQFLSALIIAFVMVLTGCSSDDKPAPSERGLPPTPSTTEAPGPEYLDEPNVVPFCDKQSGVCADFPAESAETLIETKDVNANGTYAAHRQIVSTVKFHVGDGYSEYCDTSHNDADCPETETYVIDILEDNKINSDAAFKLGEGCTLDPVTVTGVQGSLKSCSPDGIPSVEQLVVRNKGYIFVASTESTDMGSRADFQEEFFNSIGVQDPVAP